MRTFWIVLLLAIIAGLIFTKTIINIFFWIWFFVFKATVFIMVVLLILALYGIYKLYRYIKSQDDE